MTIRQVKHPKERLEVSYDSSLGIQLYGDKNLYPQEMSRIIASSPTGGICLERYATFIEGNGFNDVAFSSYICNRRGDTIDGMLHNISEDMAKYRGFAIHVNYNIYCEIVSMTHIPFECCRLEEETADGKVVHIAYHPDWQGRKTREGKKLIPNKKSIRWYYQYNPKKDVVMSQIEKAGGIENYSGQILWFSFDGNNRYPVPIFDKIVTNLSTDEGLDNVKYRNVRNNFLPSGMWIKKKGSALSVTGDMSVSDRNAAKAKEDKELEAMKTFMGDENTGSMMQITLEGEESLPEWKQIESVNFDRKFTSTTEDTTERIYSAFGQEPFYCIRRGKTGFSGDILSDAYDYYNSYVSRERRCISRAIEDISRHFIEDINPSRDFSIQPIVFIRTNNQSNYDPNSQ